MAGMFSMKLELCALERVLVRVIWVKLRFIKKPTTIQALVVNMTMAAINISIQNETITHTGNLIHKTPC